MRVFGEKADKVMLARFPVQSGGSRGGDGDVYKRCRRGGSGGSGGGGRKSEGGEGGAVADEDKQADEEGEVVGGCEADKVEAVLIQSFVESRENVE